MSNPGKFTVTLVVLGFQVLSAAHTVFGATQNDEVLVDPTLPLAVVMDASGEGEEGAEAGVAAGFSLGFPGAGGLLSGMFTSYELSSVLIRGDSRIAVINEQRVRVGDSVGNARVTAIEPDKVSLNVDGQIQTLELYGNSIKTLVKGDD